MQATRLPGHPRRGSRGRRRAGPARSSRSARTSPRSRAVLGGVRRARTARCRSRGSRATSAKADDGRGVDRAQGPQRPAPERHQPQRRQPRVRQGRLPVHLHRRRRRRRRPVRTTRRTGARCSARSCASTSTQSCGSTALLRPDANPFAALDAGRARDLGDRAAQPVALLGRPEDRRPLDRRRRPGRATRRSTAIPAGQGRLEPRLVVPRGHAHVYDAAPLRVRRRATAARSRRYSHAHGPVGHRRLRLPRHEVREAARGPLRLRRLRAAARSGCARTAAPPGVGRLARRRSRRSASTSSGEICAVTLDGGLYAMKARRV